jgi:hypothetical protein
VYLFTHSSRGLYIGKYPPPEVGISTDDNGVKTMKRGREKGGKCKIKRKRRTGKGKGEENEKMGSKRINAK